MKILVCGVRGTYAEMAEVQKGQLQIGRVYYCLISGCDDDGNATETKELCLIVDSGLRAGKESWTTDATVMGQTREVTVKPGEGIKKAVWFLSDVKDAKRSFLLSQVPMCRFFGPLSFEVEA